MKMLIGRTGTHFFLHKYYPSWVSIDKDGFISELSKLSAKETTINIVKGLFNLGSVEPDIMKGTRFFLAYCPEYKDVIIIKENQLNNYEIIG